MSINKILEDGLRVRIKDGNRVLCQHCGLLHPIFSTLKENIFLNRTERTYFIECEGCAVGIFSHDGHLVEGSCFNKNSIICDENGKPIMDRDEPSSEDSKVSENKYFRLTPNKKYIKSHEYLDDFGCDLTLVILRDTILGFTCVAAVKDGPEKQYFITFSVHKGSNGKLPNYVNYSSREERDAAFAELTEILGGLDE